MGKSHLRACRSPPPHAADGKPRVGPLDAVLPPSANVLSDRTLLLSSGGGLSVESAAGRISPLHHAYAPQASTHGKVAPSPACRSPPPHATDGKPRVGPLDAVLPSSANVLSGRTRLLPSLCVIK